MSEIRPTIAVGFRVGMLTVEKRNAEKKNGYSVWLCRCDCGGEIALDTRCLQRGTVRDCGCVTKVKPGTTDIAGMRFGKLVALEQTDERKHSGSAVWLCKCDCGNEAIIGQTRLQNGKTTSCGCIQSKAFLNNIGITKGTSVSVLEYNKTHMSPHNTSGYTGVYQNKKTGKWTLRSDLRRNLITWAALQTKPMPLQPDNAEKR